MTPSLGRFERFAVTAGGLGFLRPAPGTWGSLPPAVVAWLLASCSAERWRIDAALVLLLIAGSLACLRFGRAAEEAFGKKDPGRVVADEVAGQAIALLGLPWFGAGAWGQNAVVAGVAFLAFRVCDIVKPPPARGWQSFGGGAGILIDDLIAGIYALAIAQVVLRLWFVPA